MWAILPLFQSLNNEHSRFGVARLFRHMLPAHLSPPPGHLSSTIPRSAWVPAMTGSKLSQFKNTTKGAFIHKSGISLSVNPALANMANALVGMTMQGVNLP